MMRNLYVKNFHPVWFVSIMGTGISSAVLYNFPYEAYWLKVCGVIMFGITTFLLGLLTAIFILNMILYPHGWVDNYLLNINNNVFLGCYAMGFESWNNMIFNIWPDQAIYLCYVLWWVSNLFSLFTAWIVVFCLVKSTKIQYDTINATLLLPVVPLTVVASTGGLIYPKLPEVLKVSTLVISFLYWSNSIALSFIITSVYFHKLFIFKIPMKPAVFTSFVPIGFLGQGAFGIQLFGSNFLTHQLGLAAPAASPANENFIIGTAIKYVCVFVAVFLETFGFFMTFIAVVSCVSYGFINPHKGWWAMTFPLGTMALSTNETYKLMHWPAFRVISAMYSVALIVITIVCLVISFIYEFPLPHTKKSILKV